MNMVAVVFFSIIDMIAALSNFAVLCIILPRTYMRTVSNLFLVGLTSTQLFMSALVIPFSIVTFSQESWQFGDGFCQFQGFLTIFLSISSATFISVISVDRFFSLSNPMSHAANVTSRHVLFASIFNWFHSAFWAAFPLFGLEGLKYNYVPAKNGCGFRWDLKGSYFIYYYFIAMESFLLTFFTMCLMYFKSLQTARKSARQVRPGNIQIQVLQNGEFTSVAQTNNNFQSLKANCTLTLIIGSFMISRGPLTIFNIITSFAGEGYFSALTETIVSFMLFLGPLFDSMVYVLLNRKLRKEVFLILRKCFRKRDEEEEPKDIVDYLRTLTDNYVSKRNSSTEIEEQ
ncbi:G-protein coupled receptor 161-like [Oculina patagonica]